MKIKIQWPLVLFSLLAGLGACLYIFTVMPSAFGQEAAPGAFTTTIIAMVIVVIGGFCSVLHLAHFTNSMAVITNIFSMSGISLELILLGATFVDMLVFVVALANAASILLLQIVAIIGIVLSILLAFFCGHGYVMPGRPQWDTKVLPYAYAGSALAGGAFLFVVVELVLGVQPALVSQLAPWYVVAAVVCALVCLVYGVHVVRSNEQKSPRLKAITYGGMFVCGIIATLVCSCAILFVGESLEALAVLGAVGFVCSLLAGLAVRVAMWETSECFLPLFDFSEIGKTM